MFNVIAKIAAGAAIMAVSNYAGKAIGEKLAREPALVKAKKAKAARELADLLIDIDARGIETKLHKETFEYHQEARASGCENAATAMVVEVKDLPHVGFYQVTLIDEETCLFVDGRLKATFNTDDFRSVLKEAIVTHIFVVGYNMED